MGTTSIPRKGNVDWNRDGDLRACPGSLSRRTRTTVRAAPGCRVHPLRQEFSVTKGANAIPPAVARLEKPDVCFLRAAASGFRYASLRARMWALSSKRLNPSHAASAQWTDRPVHSSPDRDTIGVDAARFGHRASPRRGNGQRRGGLWEADLPRRKDRCGSWASVLSNPSRAASLRLYDRRRSCLAPLSPTAARRSRYTDPHREQAEARHRTTIASIGIGTALSMHRATAKLSPALILSHRPGWPSACSPASTFMLARPGSS